MSEENKASNDQTSAAKEQGISNEAIADQFSLLSKLMDIHGENAFKAKTYASAAYTVEKLASPLAGMSEAQVISLRGIGESVGKKVMEILATGSLKALQDLLQNTPEGVLEMMNIKGLGPKKINVLWKEMHIDTIAELEKACRENRIAAKKGFGAKTEQKILEAIDFVRSNEGYFLYKQVEDFAWALQEKLEAKFPQEQFALTGNFRRQMEAVNKLEWVTTALSENLKSFLVNDESEVLSNSNETLVIKTSSSLPLIFHYAKPEAFAQKLFLTTGNEEFLAAWENTKQATNAVTEEGIFQQAGLHFIPPFLRENNRVIEKAKTESFGDVVQISSIKGLIHSHSNWSDGGNTIEQMAEELIRQGFEYLVISDHSKSAYYANGLSEQRIREQHKAIDALNKKLHPFKIFKSIECDILGDGSLDYDNKTLASFDLVITSVHSNLDMDEDKAMMRLLGAIANPYTTILGHATGRLVLRRKGYPIDHKAIINACVRQNVVIEINASPSRLDLDWRWIEYAVEKGAMLSINPDAHTLENFGYIKYGTLVAQKGGLPTAKNLSSFSLREFEDYLAETKRIKGNGQ